MPEPWAGFPGRAFGGFLAAAVLVAASEQTQQAAAYNFTRTPREIMRPTGAR